MSAGTSHTCAIDTTGAAYCWGTNIFGQLGDGTTVNRSVPTAVTPSQNFAAISAGNGHTCGLVLDHFAVCWGSNASGKLGTGNTRDAHVPTVVAMPLSFSSISAASSHTCALSIDGKAYCWGSNSWGQLGVTGADAPSPVLAASGLVFRSLSAGGYDYSDESHNAGTSGHTCGVTTDGAVYCWGDNLALQLGVPAPTHSNAPVRVL
jgi:alpha-tubulin suppressor-like RCC1 family protein